MTARRAAWTSGAVLFVIYLATMAPGVTFWDAGEFIAAANVFGIPHPPGTPLFVALGRAWIVLAGGVAGVARAMNLLSVMATASAGALTAWIVARKEKSGADAAWAGIAGALCAGLMTSVWANATETEVYAISLVHVVLMLACAARSADVDDRSNDRWTLLTAYLIALAPAVHLSALVGAPAAIVLAARTPDARWRTDRMLLLGGTLVAAAGVGRMSWLLVVIGFAVSMSCILLRRENRTAAIRSVAFALIATSGLFILLLRARHDPAVNQGNPATLASLVDVVARHQYDVAPLWPRQAPIWIQLATLAEYVDWQFAMSWGRGVFTTPARVMATVVFVALGAYGWRAMRRESRAKADALAILVVCGTLGVCAYLNLKAGWSIGYGFVPTDAHEARERDYFFVLGFWGWGVFAGYGAVAFARVKRIPAGFACAVALIPLVGNWTVNDRARGDSATAAREVGSAFLASAPPNALLFLAGDNDTYPLWYLQQVEGLRRDVTLVTIPLLPASWYGPEIARRTGLAFSDATHTPGAQWAFEDLAASQARAAFRAGRPVAVSVMEPARMRNLLGSGWSLRGVVYVMSAVSRTDPTSPVFDTTFVMSALSPQARADARARQTDDVAPYMRSLLECPRLAVMGTGVSRSRDSLETRCNFR